MFFITIFRYFQNCNTLCAITQGCPELINVCDVNEECCNSDHFNWNPPGIGRNIVYLVMIGIILYIILFLKEFGFFDKIHYKLFHKTDQKVLDEIPTIALDSDVQAEKVRVRNMSMEEIRESNMVMMDMVKVYKKFPAVKGVSVAVKE